MKRLWQYWVLAAIGAALTFTLFLNALVSRRPAEEAVSPEPAAPGETSLGTDSSRRPDASRTKAIAFIMDTSGSMTTKLDGRRRIDCAKESLLRILELYKRHDDEAHDLEAGLWCFGLNAMENPLPLGTFSYEKLRRAVSRLDSPTGGTPFGTRLGTAIDAAAKALSSRPAASRAIVFLTDGENTGGPAPDDVYRTVRSRAETAGKKPIDLYLVAFTVERKHFAALQALGAKVEEANSADSLTRVFSDYSSMILEEPEPAAAPAPAPTPAAPGK